VKAQHTDEFATKTSERGVGLIEIVISMFLLALLAMSFFPVLVNGMKTSVLNAKVATASQIVGQQLDLVRAVTNNCASVSAFDDVALAEIPDARGNHFQPNRQVGVCPATYPGVVKVTAWVTEVGQTHRLAEAATLVYLTTAVAAP
jgi:type II secretory pathway pseudopilin PulG